MRIKIVNESRHPLPEYSTPLSAGMDLRANVDKPVELAPLERKLRSTNTAAQRTGSEERCDRAQLTGNDRRRLSRRNLRHSGQSVQRNLHRERWRANLPDDYLQTRAR